MPCLDLCLLVFTRTGSGKLSLALSSSEPGQESCLVPPCLEVDQPMSQAAKEPRSQGAMQASSQGAKEPRSQAAKELSSQGAQQPGSQGDKQPWSQRSSETLPHQAKELQRKWNCHLYVGCWSESGQVWKVFVRQRMWFTLRKGSLPKFSDRLALTCDVHHRSQQAGARRSLVVALSGGGLSCFVLCFVSKWTRSGKLPSALP